MSDAGEYRNLDEEIEAALLDADLFVKYGAPQKAIKKLQATLEQHPRSLGLREKLREVAIAGKQPEEAARQCLALASLYITREDFETAHDRLLAAKQLDPRINIATGLQAIRRARHPNLQASAAQQHYESPAAAAGASRRHVTFAGDLAAVSIFDAVQVIENSRLTGALVITDTDAAVQTDEARVLFNEGRIVGAEAAGLEPLAAFRRVVETTVGTFDFEKSAQPFPVHINAASNTNLLLDTLRQLDEEKADASSSG